MGKDRVESRNPEESVTRELGPWWRSVDLCSDLTQQLAFPGVQGLLQALGCRRCLARHRRFLVSVLVLNPTPPSQLLNICQALLCVTTPWGSRRPSPCWA